jgi:NAD(P)-dependent dehydrogenase (short-subunit alcohol dehydrogenase family)
MPEFAGRVVIVTGASGGLGGAVVEQFLALGASVIGVTRGGMPERQGLHPVGADLTDAAAARRVVEAALDVGGRVDCLAHLVGGFAMGDAVTETGNSVWDRMLGLNLETAVHMIQAVVPEMLRAGRGRVIAVGAKAALQPAAKMGAYCASKAALHSLIRSLASEVKDSGITANAVLPSIIDTPANRKAMPKADPSRWVRPEAIAQLVAWLASNAAADVSGALIPISGRV